MYFWGFLGLFAQWINAVLCLKVGLKMGSKELLHLVLGYYHNHESMGWYYTPLVVLNDLKSSFLVNFLSAMDLVVTET